MAALDALLGNEALKENLLTALRAGRLSHSILLCGEAGVGAGFAARCLAADYLYPDGGDGARQVMAGQSAECLRIEGEGASGEIRVDRVRAVRREIYNTGLSAAGRVVLLTGADRMNAPSANALLKVLEEPPSGVLFLLTASSEAGVLATIRSRCCVYSLAPVSEEACAAYLRRHFPNRPDAARDAALFGGRLGTAKKCLSSEEGRARLADARALAERAEKRDAYGALLVLSKYEKDRFAARVMLALLRGVCGASLRGAPAARELLSPPRAARGADAVRETLLRLSGNGNGKLAMTLLAAQLTAEIP